MSAGARRGARVEPRRRQSADVAPRIQRCTSARWLVRRSRSSAAGGGVMARVTSSSCGGSDPAPRPAHVLYMGRDVTERKRTEEALRASEEQYRAIFNASADALVLWDNQYRRVDVNPPTGDYAGPARKSSARATKTRASLRSTRRHVWSWLRRALAARTARRARGDSQRRNRIRTEVHAIPFRHVASRTCSRLRATSPSGNSPEEALRARRSSTFDLQRFGPMRCCCATTRC